jgi:hypothetical protein
MNKVLDKDKKIKHYSDKIDRLQREIHNKREEIKLSLLKLAELQDCKVYQIPSTYSNVDFIDYVIAKDENEAKEIGITESYFDEIFEVNGSGEIYEEDIKEFK